jgi:hypothetical protein
MAIFVMGVAALLIGGGLSANVSVYPWRPKSWPAMLPGTFLMAAGLMAERHIGAGLTLTIVGCLACVKLWRMLK